jgi:sugar (pentulose or hexulose) kinase
MKKKYILAIDCGTQSIRGMIFDTEGKMIAKESYLFHGYYSKKPHYYEADPQMFWDGLCKVTNKLKLNNNVFDYIKGISVATMRDTSICVDKNGEPVRDAIIWLDNRKLEKPIPMSLKYRLLFAIVNFTDIAEYMNKTCHGHWVMKNEPEIWSSTEKFLQLSTFLNYKLTGEYVDSNASAVGHIPYGYKTKEWDKPSGIKSQIFQIDHKKLYDLVSPFKLLGTITKQASEETGLPEGLPVVAAGSDKSCETIGVGCVNNEMGSISLGSQTTIQTTTTNYYELITFFPPFPALKPDAFNPEIIIYRGFWMLNWFKEEFMKKEKDELENKGKNLDEFLNSKIIEIEAGSAGLLLQPFWGQELLRPEARGCMIGFHDEHTKYHIYRAMIEGLGYALLEGIERIEKKSKSIIKEFGLSGGGSQSDVICQIMADILNRPVYRVQTSETTGLGAAIAGFLGVEIYSDLEKAISEMVHKDKIYFPNENNVKIYSELYTHVYKKTYKRVKPLYEKIYQIQGKDN